MAMDRSIIFTNSIERRPCLTRNCAQQSTRPARFGESGRRGFTELQSVVVREITQVPKAKGKRAGLDAVSTGKKPLPRINGLSREEQLAREDENVRECLRYAKEKLND